MSRIAVGDDVVVAGGAFTGEKGVVVAIDDDQITVELTLSGQATRMAFDVSALRVATRDPRAAFRRELETYFARAAREDIVRWFAGRDDEEDLLETDELACLYQIASPLRREYLKVMDEVDATDETRFEELRAGWLARITPAPLDDATRTRGLARMERVRAVAPSDEDRN